MRAGRYEKARQWLNVKLSENPELEDVRVHGAGWLWEVGKREWAIAMIDATPEILHASGRLSKMSAVLHLQLAQDGPNLVRTRGMVAYTVPDGSDEEPWIKEQFALAEASATIFLDSKMDTEGAVNLLLKIYAVQAKWNDVLELANEYLKTVRASPDLIAYEAQALHKVAQHRKAQALAQSSLKKHPKHIRLLETLAESSKALGQLQVAEKARDANLFYRFLLPDSQLSYRPELGKLTRMLSESIGQGETNGFQSSLMATSQLQANAAAELLAAFVRHHTHDGAEKAALLALESIGTESHPVLFRLIARAQSVCTIRETAAVIARQKAAGAFPVLIDLLDKEQHEFEPMEIPHALAVLGDKRAIPALAKIVSSGNSRDLRLVSATVSLGVLGGKSARKVLKEAAKNPKTRKAAEVALCLHALQGTSARSRCTALEALIVRRGGPLEHKILVFDVLVALATMPGAEAARLHKRLKAAQKSAP